MKKLFFALIMVMAGMIQASTPTMTFTLTYTFSPTTTPTPSATPTVTITVTPVNTVVPNATQTPHVAIFDAAQILTMTAGLTSWTTSYSMGSGVSPAFIAHVFMPQGTQVDKISSLTYGGIPMTKLLTNMIGTQSSHPYSLSTWILLNAPTGANNLVIGLSASQASEVVIGMESWLNVKYPSNVSGFNTRSVGLLSGTFYTGVDGATLIGCFAVYDSAGQTTIAGNPPMTNRAIYSVGGSENVYMSLDDVRNYTATSTPVNWVYNGASPDPVNMQYLELVPR